MGRGGAGERKPEIERKGSDLLQTVGLGKPKTPPGRDEEVDSTGEKSTTVHINRASVPRICE
jgi:hypothetical protein